MFGSLAQIRDALPGIKDKPVRLERRATEPSVVKRKSRSYTEPAAARPASGTNDEQLTSADDRDNSSSHADTGIEQPPSVLDPDIGFENALQELQGALAILHSSAGPAIRARVEPDFDLFEAPLAELESVVTRLSPSSGRNVEQQEQLGGGVFDFPELDQADVFEAPLSELMSALAYLRRPSVPDVDSFEAPLNELESALARLQCREPGDVVAVQSDAEVSTTVDSFEAPLNELESALARLQCREHDVGVQSDAEVSTTELHLHDQEPDASTAQDAMRAFEAPLAELQRHLTRMNGQKNGCQREA